MNNVLYNRNRVSKCLRKVGPCNGVMTEVFMYRCFCMSHFNPTINSNMLQYISTSADKLNITGGV